MPIFPISPAERTKQLRYIETRLARYRGYQELLSTGIRIPTAPHFSADDVQWLYDELTRSLRVIRGMETACGCDGEPLMCNHEEARLLAEQKLEQARKTIADMRDVAEHALGDLRFGAVVK